MKRGLFLAFALGLLVGAAIPAAGSASVHFPKDNNWLDDHYEIDNSRQHPFAIGQPGSNFYYRAKDGAAAWSAISGSGLDFVFQGQRSMSPSLHECNIDHDETWVMDYWTSGAGGIWNVPSSGNVDGKVTGVAEVCGPNGTIDHTLISVNHDDDITWEWTKWGSVGSNEVDLHGVMVHEFGHAVGGIDFYGSECTSFYTMCGIGANGISYKRTITSHEKSDVAAKY